MWKVLQDVRVLDLSRVFAGPAATQILGDLGADIIKVEEPGRGDEARHFGITPELSARGETLSASFVALNRNKRSIAIDLSTSAGRRAVLRMARGCDVVVHNFRPGGMQKFGLDYDALRGARPDIILCEFYAYGATGPLAHLGANDLALQAHSGMMSITGEPDRPPVRCGTSVVDLHASLALVIAILAALHHRSRTGEGQRVETSLLRSSAHLMNYFYGEYWARGVVRGRMGTANHLSVPNQVFPAADGDVVIIAPSDDMWRRCAVALDRERLDRAEWATSVDRQRHRSVIIAELSAVTRGLTCRELLERLGAAKVNVAKVNDIGEAAMHPQLAAIGALVEFAMEGRAVRGVASPFALDGPATAPDRGPPALGADTATILAELGLETDEIAKLRADGAFGRAATGDAE